MLTDVNTATLHAVTKHNEHFAFSDDDENDDEGGPPEASSDFLAALWGLLNGGQGGVQPA